ncbi:MAG TPA: tetratricopeptide repeat protein [Anaerolineae bacterium]|nr:tetratricopeptide repeat protein [Anaerolineae bacterium]HQH38563.1 tetratricopeptide repeat protein [Anaerolineae bacterium]
MAEIALHQYENEINQLIEEARYVEALAHTRHILRQHPRYVGAYYLLGKILLEADQPELAIDMFYRALNADPEHLMARIGLTIAHQRLDNLNAAIWNLERAVELNPGDPDLVDELRQLYGRRDGMEPERIPLSRAGLARLYMRGNRPGRAVEELRTLLTTQPTRYDLRLALAEAYWRDDQIVQAADTCQLVLDDMRYCLKANLLLGALWVDSGQEEGQVYLNRAQEIDLENALANEMFGTASPLKPQEVKLERLTYRPGAIGIDEQAKWFKKLEASSVTVGVAEMAPEMTGAEARLVEITAGLESQIELPDWLRELETEEEGALSWMANIGAETGAAESLAGEGAAGPTEAVEEAAAGAEMPDWISLLTPETEPTAAEEEKEEVAEAETLPDWLSELEPAAPTTEGSLDWLQALAPTGAAEAAEAPVPEEGVPDWLRELKEPGVQAEPEVEPAAAELPDWLQELQPATPAAEGAAPEEEIPEWLKEATAEEITEPSRAEEGELPDWLMSFQIKKEAGEAIESAGEQPEQAGEVPPAEGITPEEALPDWLSELRPAERQEPTEEIPTAEEIPTWFGDLQPTAEAEPEAEALEEDLLAWLGDIEPEAEAPATEETAPAEEAAPTVGETPATGFFGWETFGEEAAEVETPLPEAPSVAEEGAMDWEHLAEQAEEGVAEAPTAEGDFLSGEDALAWLESLAAGKEEELRAQAEAEAQARVAEILGHKVEPAPVAPAVEPEPLVEEAPAAEAEAAPAAGFFGWETFGEEAAEVETPLPEAPSVAEEGAMDWEHLAEQAEEGVAEAPTAEGDFLSGEDALAWLESLAAGKEEELRAQAEAEAQARVAEILGHKVEPAPVAPAVEPEPLVEEAPAAEAEAAPAAGFFGWETFGEEAAEVETPLPEAPSVAEEGAMDWEHLAEQAEEGVAEAPTAEGDFLSGEDALAWLESLAAGKEEELRAQAEAEAQARVAEILGHKVEPAPVAPAVEPEPLVEEAPAAEAEAAPAAGFFGWETFGEEAAEVETPLPEAPSVAEEGAMDWEHLAEQAEEGVAEAPTAEGDFLSGEDALAWLESLAAGKEEELRAQAEAEAQARVAEILGHKPTPRPAPEPPAVEIKPVVEEAAVKETAPGAEGDLLSGEDALAWLESLAVGKEEELRAQAEAEAQARVAEILGRKPTPRPTPEPPVTETQPVVEKVSMPEVAVEAPSVTLEERAEEVSPVEEEWPLPEEEVLTVEPPVGAPLEEVAATVFVAGDLMALRDAVARDESDYASRLALARELWRAGDTEEALTHYTYLIQAQAETQEIIADLRQAAAEHPQDVALLQALGDAYMAAGRVEQALESYNRALALL